MKVVFDSNIVIDALKPNPPFAEEASKLLKLASAKKITGYLTANSLTDIFYVLRKEYDNEAGKAMIRKVTSLLTVIDLTANDCESALDLPMTDFEDAVIATCAKKVGADCVVSRNEEFIKADSEVKVMKPFDLIAQLALGESCAF